MELDKNFNFKDVDAKWSQYWEESGVFHANADSGKPTYSVVIPPPNVTGVLHMGHALNNTLQDIIVRYKRMKGFETLWMAGTDHAGIATQNVVEKQLAKEGKKRQDLGREAFLERLWEWKQKNGDTIIHQLKKIGASCDWSRARFTMDEKYCEAVKHVFVKLYEKGLIYQGKYIINWCPRCQTALSDEEAEHQDMQGNLYYFRYPFKEDSSQYLVVATTRPETMLGDTAVAVNPKDERYKDYIGKTLLVPFVNREIKIIADDFVSPEFGTGAVKVTPAHDPNDFAMGQRHELDMINIMHPNAVINNAGGEFEGMDRFEAREAIIDALKELKLLEKTEAHQHAVGHCYRCHTVVEPYLSKQWFVKMKPLAEKAIEVVKTEEIKIYPERWTKVYFNWLENIRDWCISRQIWWGHRIPVWYCDGNKAECRHPIVSKITPQECPHCGAKKLKQDEDVLDTWFSSWLWPFATLGWPEEKESIQKDLKAFYPTATLFTAPEIIFFWVARMVMAGEEFMGKIPFSEVYLHGTVRDMQGRKMSKSLGNVIDPLEIIAEYGADALRFSLIMNSGQDLYISKDKFEIGRNFANKIWNATRLILMNTSNVECTHVIGNAEMDLPSQWIISRLNSTLETVSDAIEKYRYSEAETLIYEFFRGNFCDWYLEMIKNSWADETVQKVALGILHDSLKMMHPFMPFVTEEIWSHLKKEEKALCIQSWPEVEKECINTNIEKDMQMVLDIITVVRNIRAQWNIKPKEKIQCFLSSSSEKERAVLNKNIDIIKNLARIETLTIEQQLSKTNNVAIVMVEGVKCAVLLEGLIDLEQEKQKITTQIEELKKASQGLSQRLGNQKFLERAPKDIVEKEKERLQSLENKIKELHGVLCTLA